jgi:hypothetical protein
MVFVGGPLSQVVRLDVNNSRGARAPDDPIIKGRAKKIRENCNDVDA